MLDADTVRIFYHWDFDKLIVYYSEQEIKELKYHPIGNKSRVSFFFL